MKPLSWAGRTLPNNLQVLEELGSTSDGMLYRARHRTGQEVALLIASDESPGHPLFQQALRIRHLNVAAVLEIGEIPGGPDYVVLELVSGEPLSDLLAREGTIPLEAAGELFFQAAAGVQAAHDVGLVHADLSPENFLVTRTPGGLLVKLIRFAPHTTASPTNGGVHLINAAYASPERLAGHPPDARSDIYGLGAVLHHMLVGFPPGSGTANPECKATWAVVNRTIHPIPEQRYQRVPQLVRAMRRAIARDAAGRPRSRRALALTAAGIVAVLVGGMWLGATTPLRGRVPARPAEPMATSFATDAEAQPLPEPSPTDSSPPAAPASTLPPAVRAMAPVPDARSEERVVSEEHVVPDEPSVSESMAADTGVAGYLSAESIDTGESLPAAAPAPLTPDERAAVDQRIGLDEATQVLGGPAHAIEGMLPIFMGLANGRLPEGADPSRLLVRTVYLDRNGGLILLDQQRIVADSIVEDVPGKHWVIGDVMLFLHGDAGEAMLANLAKRVR